MRNAKAALAIQAAIASLAATGMGASLIGALLDPRQGGEGPIHVPVSDWQHDEARVSKAEAKRKRRAERNKRNLPVKGALK